MVKPTGFREYDARWLFEKEINLMGVQALGLGLARCCARWAFGPKSSTGHDFRSYSASIKLALITGLMAAGVKVHDIGLALSPMAYFAQFELDVPAVAMVTASHNDNGWTGVKMGAQRPVTFGPDEMGRLKEIVIGGKFVMSRRRRLSVRRDFPARYIADLTNRPKLAPQAEGRRRLRQRHGRRLRAGDSRRSSAARSSRSMRARLHFPALQSQSRRPGNAARHGGAVRESGADVGLGFDGDGDRCGVVDNNGDEIFADKIGVMLARDLSKLHPRRDIRRRRQVDRAVRHRSGARAPMASRPITGRPDIPISSAG